MTCSMNKIYYNFTTRRRCINFFWIYLINF